MFYLCLSLIITTCLIFIGVILFKENKKLNIEGELLVSHNNHIHIPLRQKPKHIKVKFKEGGHHHHHHPGCEPRHHHCQVDWEVVVIKGIHHLKIIWDVKEHEIICYEIVF